MNTERLFELIEAFQARVRMAIELFREHRGISDPLDWRQHGLPRVGFITDDKRFAYAFHGIGCRAETPEGEIDWDFGESGRADGVDLWRLQRFVDASPREFPEFERGELLADLFEAAIRGGLLRKDPSEQAGHLYYRPAA